MLRFMDEAKRLIRMNSVTSNGNEEVANAVLTLMQDCGMRRHTNYKIPIRVIHRVVVSITIMGFPSNSKTQR
jgi:hypothetical protein